MDTAICNTNCTVLESLLKMYMRDILMLNNIWKYYIKYLVIIADGDWFETK